jgi:transposase
MLKHGCTAGRTERNTDIAGIGVERYLDALPEVRLHDYTARARRLELTIELRDLQRRAGALGFRLVRLAHL